MTMNNMFEVALTNGLEYHMKVKEVWHTSGKKLVMMIEKGFFLSKERKIRFYAPNFINYKTNYLCSSPSFFPSISITGSSCALNCRHCNKKLLNTMLPVHSPKELFELCKKLKEKGASGCLISGGCLPDGSVPIDEFIDAITKVKKELELIIVVHTLKLRLIK